MSADNMRTVSWFSAGVSSAVATKWAIDNLGCKEIYYIEIDDHHPDNERFVADCERWFGIEVHRMSSPYRNVTNVLLATRFINGPRGASCSLRLKRRVRKEWERKQKDKICYVWGLDIEEKTRAANIVLSMPDFGHRFPLIELGIFKDWAHFIIINNAGIARPKTYDMGFPNNNCIGCVKGGKGYWNLIRKLFPDVFELRAKTEREVGHSCMNGLFLDELPPDAGINKIVVPSCDLYCEMQTGEIAW